MSGISEEKKQSPVTKKVTAKMAPKDPVVYIGPDIPGVKRATTFNNGLPKILEQQVKERPYLSSLIVPCKRLAQASAELGREGSALAILYKRAEKDIKEGGIGHGV